MVTEAHASDQGGPMGNAAATLTRQEQESLTRSASLGVCRTWALTEQTLDVITNTCALSIASCRVL
jgi:hypothetical protein